jgi:acid phosphatase
MLLRFLFAAALTLQMRSDVLRIAVVGDVGDGAGPVAAGIARLHREAPFDAILITGDNIYPCGVSSASDPKWELLRPLSDLGLPLYPILGNHDHCGNPDAQIGATTLPNWRFPAREYILRTAVADFAMLDTTPYVRGSAPPAIPATMSAPWRIAIGHHPLLSSGYHGRFSRAEHRRMMRLIPAMREADIDLYICGHDHHLELIDARPRMLISGAGSNPIPPLVRHAKTLWANEGPPYRGFAVMEISSTSLAIRFYDATGKARSKTFSFAPARAPAPH